MKTDRFAGIEDFVAAADAGSFALAARRRQLTRSAVAKSIARLEARLGVRLFVRTTRSQSLTREGEAYLERCQRVLSELEAVEASRDEARRRPAGRVRMSVPVLFGRLYVGPLLLDLARQHPQLEFDVSFSDRRSDLVEDGLDLAVRSGPLQDQAGLVARRLCEPRMVTCASPAYIAARGAPAGFDSLGEHPCIVYGRAGRMRPWEFRDAAGKRIAVTVSSRLCFDDLMMIASATSAGMGIARLPIWLVNKALEEGSLVQVFDELHPVGHEMNVVWPKAPYMPLRTRSVVDCLVAAVPSFAD